MVRTIADGARRRYDRWYILAHSLGAVVAHNGLMEPASSWPGYFDEVTWTLLKREGLAGAKLQELEREAVFARLGIRTSNPEPDRELPVALARSLAAKTVEIDRFFFDWRVGAGGIRRPRTKPVMTRFLPIFGHKSRNSPPQCR